MSIKVTDGATREAILVYNAAWLRIHDHGAALRAALEAAAPHLQVQVDREAAVNQIVELLVDFNVGDYAIDPVATRREIANAVLDLLSPEGPQ